MRRLSMGALMAIAVGVAVASAVAGTSASPRHAAGEVRTMATTQVTLVIRADGVALHIAREGLALTFRF